MNKNEERFWSKVDKSGDCWLWTAGNNGTGYGQFWLDGCKQYAHRVSYLWYVGEIPEGIDIDHRCHSRSCVRPVHLRRATRKQNNENLEGARSGTISGVLGVHWRKNRNRWLARVRHNGVLHSAGQFKTVEEAEAAVIAKRNELFTHNDRDKVSK